MMLVAGGTWILAKILSRYPDWAESCYGNGLFPHIRRALDQIHWPIPILHVMWVLLVLFILHSAMVLFFGSKPLGMSVRIILRRFLAVISILVIWFYWIWGFNYARPDLQTRMNWHTVQPDTTWLFNEIDQVIEKLNVIRQHPDLSSLQELTPDEIIHKPVEIQKINQELENILPNFHYHTKTKPQLNFITPDGFLLHWSTSGIYWLFSGECNVDSGVHYLKKPVTVAHELAHAHGLTAEGDCNFIAYVACVQSDDRLHQYSAHLSYLSYLMSDALKVLGRKKLNRFYSRMSDDLKKDRQAIFDHHNQYSDYFPKLRNAFYDSYLKSQGIKDGIKSYSYFVNLKYKMDQLGL